MFKMEKIKAHIWRMSDSLMIEGGKGAPLIRAPPMCHECIYVLTSNESTDDPESFICRAGAEFTIFKCFWEFFIDRVELRQFRFDSSDSFLEIFCHKNIQNQYGNQNSWKWIIFQLIILEFMYRLKPVKQIISNHDSQFRGLDTVLKHQRTRSSHSLWKVEIMYFLYSPLWKLLPRMLPLMTEPS